jgi:hypothetical protein
LIEPWPALSRRYGLFHQQTGNIMLSQLKAKLTAVHAAVRAPIRQRLGPFMLACFIAVAGCAPPVAPLSGADPADPKARTAAVGYRSAIGSYTALRPAAPAVWGDQNDSVAPKAEPPQ